MTNPPGAMPPLPPKSVIGVTGNGTEYRREIWGYAANDLHAYAAPLIARVAELQAERDRIDRNRDMWKGQCERQAEQLTAMRKSLAFFVIHPGVWQLCSPDSEVMREAKASIDAAIAAKD